MPVPAYFYSLLISIGYIMEILESLPLFKYKVAPLYYTKVGSGRAYSTPFHRAPTIARTRCNGCKREEKPMVGARWNEVE